MAPFDNPSTAKLTTKISPVLTDTMPEFVVSVHPIFTDFLKTYYEFLESAELQLTVTINNVLLETSSDSSLLDEEGNEVVLEKENGTTGKFEVGETITGSTSKATAKILADDLGNSTPRIFITSNQQFITGETVTGATSAATGVVVKYRGNPIQNIQQLLEYANVDNTIYDFLDKMRDAFMVSIPDDLTDGLDKRNIIKNIRELYAVKGTREGHKLFMKMLLNDDVIVNYPNEFMIRASDGRWNSRKLLRTVAGPNSLGTEIVGQKVTGATSGATGVVASTEILEENKIEITQIELDLDSVVGTFQDDETITATSNTTDFILTFTVKNIVDSISVTDDKRGSLYSVGSQIDFENRGNNLAVSEVTDIGTGSVKDIYVDDGGTDYKVGDRIIFTTGDDEVSTSNALGVVSILDGAMQLNGTDTDSTDAGDFIVIEDGTSTHLESFGVQLEDETVGVEPFSVFGTDTLYSDTKGYYYPLYLSFQDAERANDGSPAGVAHKHIFEEYKNQEFWMPSNFANHAKSTNVSSLTILGVSETITLYGLNLVFNRTNTTGASGTGDSATGGLDDRSVMLMDDYVEPDEFKTDGDRIAIEFGTDTQNEAISRAVVLKSGGGYKKLPTAAVSSEFGSDATVFGTTDDIGSIKVVGLKNPGFDYAIVPDATARANFQVKDVTGEFKTGEALTSHTGTVRNYDGTRQIIEVSFEDVVRTKLETTDAIPMELEDVDSDGDAISGIDKTQKSILVADRHLPTEEALITEDGDYIVTDAEFVTDFNLRMEDGTTGDSFFDILRQEGTRVEVISNIILDATDTSGGDINGKILFEGSDDVFLVAEHDTTPQFLVADGSDSSGTNAGANLVSERTGGSNVFGNKFIAENFSTIVPDVDGEGEYFLLENSNGVVHGVGQRLVTDASLDTLDESGNSFRLVLDGTDSDSSNAGGLIVNETDSGSIDILLEDIAGTIQGRLLQEISPQTGAVALNGINTSSTHAGDNLIHELDGIDFSAGTTTISTASGSATIVNVNIAKTNATIGSVSETTPGYDTYLSQLSHDLIRLQDSFFYQQFSYEIVTAYGTDDWINALRKAVHPAGFAAFGKVQISTQLDAKTGTIGARLGGGFAHPAAPGTITSIVDVFDSVQKMNFQTIEFASGSLTDNITLEEAPNNYLEDDGILLDGTDSDSSNAGGSLLGETILYSPRSVQNMQLEDATVDGRGGVLVLNGKDSNSTGEGDRLLIETAVDVSFNLVLESSLDGDLLLDGSDSSGSNAGDSFELQDILQEVRAFKFETVPAEQQSLLLEEGAGKMQLETSGTGGVDETTVRRVTSFASTKIGLPVVNGMTTSGIETISQSLFEDHGFLMEDGTGVILLDGYNYKAPMYRNLNMILYSSQTGSESYGANFGGSNVKMLLEEETATQQKTGPIISDFINFSTDFLVLDGSNGSSANAGENMLLENATIGSGNTSVENRLVSEDKINFGFSLGDIQRSDLLILNEHANETSTDDNVIGILLEDSEESGTFRLEDGTTNATSFGDFILVEGTTPPHNVNSKFILETMRFELEEEHQKGTVPLQSRSTDGVRFARPTMIDVKQIGFMTLEDASSGSRLSIDRTDTGSTDAGDKFLIEEGTQESFLLNV